MNMPAGKQILNQGRDVPGTTLLEGVDGVYRES
jgi:hypothetical protein